VEDFTVQHYMSLAGNNFQPSLIIVTKAEAYPSGGHYGAALYEFR
jgi:hypothetical protein